MKTRTDITAITGTIRPVGTVGRPAKSQGVIYIEN